MRAIDLPTLVIILAAGLLLGLQGCFGWDPATMFGPYTRLAYLVVGASALWQFTRQQREIFFAVALLVVGLIAIREIFLR